MSIINTIVSRFPVRKSADQKRLFREWAIEEAGRLGYDAREEKNGISRNVVIGDPAAAKAVFTAHYDTPPRMPFPNLCTPSKKLMFYTVQIGLGMTLVVAGAIAGVIAGLIVKNVQAAILIGDGILFALCALMMFGPANPNCVNDNSSGVAAVLQLMERLPEDQRGKAAFILFDNEEKGLLGSSAYAKQHKDIKTGRLLINMDCVGDGETMLFLANRLTRENPAYPLLVSCVQESCGIKPLFLEKEHCAYPSDQNNYKLGMGVCACKKGPRLGYYFDKIHTAKDTVCRQENLDFLAENLGKFVEKL